MDWLAFEYPVNSAEQSCYFNGAFMNLVIGEALILVDDVGQICILVDG